MRVSDSIAPKSINTLCMKRFLASLLTLLLAAPISFTYAADQETDRLEVTVPATAKIGEAVDLTVKAVAKDGSVVKNYAGTVFVIVDNDNKATVPYAEGYTFTNADQGQKVFSKGLSFTKEGTFKVVVSDFDKPKIEGSNKVKVGGGDSSTPTTGTELVTITSPDNNSTLGSKDISVTGTTKKNSKVQLFVNGTKALESQTDEKGQFMFQAKNVDQTTNVLSVKVLDGTDKVIGESSKVSVQISADGPVMKSVSVTSGAEKGTKADTYSATAGAQVTLSVTAEAGLKEVSASAGGVVTLLKETSAGIYTGNVTAPKTVGIAAVDVSLKNDLGKTTLKTGALSLDVQTPKTAFKNVKVETGDKKATFTFEVENEPTTVAKYEFEFVTGTGAAKKATTFEKDKIKNGSGAYVWYITGLDIAQYSFVISGVDAAGAKVAGVMSDTIDVDLSLGAAGKCIISNVAGLRASTAGDVSTLSWDAIPEAASYKVYKKDATGNFVFIASTKGTTYTIQVSSGPVKYEEFTVKAVCADATESKQFAPSTRVQTGPAQIFLFIVLALGLGYFLLRRKGAI